MALLRMRKLTGGSQGRSQHLKSAFLADPISLALTRSSVGFSSFPSHAETHLHAHRLSVREPPAQGTPGHLHE